MRNIEINDLKTLINELDYLIKKLIKLKNKILDTNKNLNDKSQDARLVSISNCIEITSVFRGFFVIIYNLKKNDKFRNIIDTNDLKYFILSSFKINRDIDLNFIDSIVNRNIIICLVDYFYFTFDNLFKNIVINIDPKAKRGYYENYKRILEKLGKKENGIFGKRLKCLSLLRNSFHNNGVHKRGDEYFKHKIGNKIFLFKKDEPHYNGSWEYIITLLDSCIDIIGSILLNKLIWNKDKIEDEFNEKVKKYNYNYENIIKNLIEGK